jgi:hypothetical protein
MNALRYSLKQLLTAHRDRKFVVPNYQREYEWETPSEGKGEVGQFKKDHPETATDGMLELRSVAACKPSNSDLAETKRHGSLSGALSARILEGGYTQG